MRKTDELILVTGGTGFVGSWAIVRLLQQGYRVRTTVRSLKKEAQVRAAIAPQVDPQDRLTFVAADLTTDTGWAAAMQGVDRVLHVASPMHTANSADIQTFLKPQREGDERLLRFAAAAGVQHVVITSAAAAAKPADDSTNWHSDETVWTQPNDPVQNPYQRSKALAEKAAWDWMADYDGPMQLTTVLPTAVFGPVLMPQNNSSQQLITLMLRGRLPGVFNIGFDIVDVRDLVDLEIMAMRSDQAAGQRYLAVADNLKMKAIAQLLKARVPVIADRVHTNTIPDWLLRLVARLNANAAVFIGLLNRQFRYTSAKAQRDLGWQPRSAETTLIDAANRMEKLGLLN
ncbi:NAD-dependent epimerase/dehydratase family protein [Lactiplantibacillus garii]|uniref:NAD-dependent epimerase/dehydratase family protein n=1 Tax=Lactiplantibacillus garii TaxID=2306423 RepID=A0A3R8J5S5_9LACO|nr:NAD-dependent epimerase/dehydratase family protein [Lactiplantibacillus garii]RRK09673.1 NAD-dependent epimerase/dehydratase family protein [Lactiplantibacillus garii]